MPQTKKKQPFTFTPYPGTEPVQPQQVPVQPITSNDIQRNLDAHLKETIAPITRPVVSSLSTISDLFSRGQYASAKFFDSSTDDSKTMLDAVSDAFNEFVSPKEKLSFSDLITKRNPQLAKDNPKAVATLGFLADLALDPLSYVGIGLTKKGIGIGGKTLKKAGLDTLQTGIKGLEGTQRFVSATGDDVLKILDKEAIRFGKGAQQFTVESKLKLSDAGYFDRVAQKTDEVESFAKSNGVNLPRHEAAMLAREEVYKDLKNQRRVASDTFGIDEVRETIEDRISRIAEFDPNANLKLFEPSGLRLTVGVPFGKRYDLPKYVPGSRESLKLLGFDFVQNKIREIGRNISAADKVKIPIIDKQIRNPFNVAGRAFSKEFDPNKNIPQEFWDELHQIENTFDSVTDSTIRTTRQMFKDIPTDRRTEIGKVMADVRDASYLEEQRLGRPLTTQEANDIRNIALSSAKLNTQEFAIVSQLYHDYSKMAELEMRSDLLNYSITNYTPRKWQMLSDPSEVPDLLRAARQGKLNVGMSSSKATKYATIAEGIADGNVPELDAAVLYAHRLINHKEKVAVANFNQSTRYIFGFDPSPKPLTNLELGQLPKVVQSNIRMLGDAVYPPGMDDVAEDLLRGWDRVNKWFKIGAYAIKPSAAPRQLLSNTFQAAMLQGAKAFKAFDPRAAIDAGLLLFDRGKQSKSLPPSIMNFFGKYAGSADDAVLAQRIALDKVVGVERLNDFSNNFKLKSSLGQEYDGKYLVDWMLNNGVIKGFDASGETMKTKVERALRTNTDSVASVAGELSKFWKWPQLTEDYSRAMVFLNGLRMGYSEKDSLKMVNKALFDYSRGLSLMEKKVFKRIIPFYTYQRFAIPFVFKQVISKPGEAITGEKLMKLMEKLIVSENDTLTPSEREAIPGYVLEQPRLYRGFDKDQKAKFNIFNNMTPLDALSILQYDKEGNLDFRRTMERTVLAQMTPFLKIPLEELVNKNFFTEQTIEKAGKLGDINASTLSAVLPTEFKDLIGWENRIDKRNGRQAVYINPYYAHRALGFVPGLKSWIIDPADQGQSYLEAAMDLLFGVKTDRYDLKESAQYKKLREIGELKDAMGRIRSAYKRGAMSEYTKAKEDYMKLIDTIKENRKFSLQDVRGQGINPVDVPPMPDEEQDQQEQQQ